MIPCAGVLSRRAPQEEPLSVHGGGSDRLNETPVDHLIRAIIETRRRATAAEVEQITERIATAPFEAVRIHVPLRLRLTYQGQVLGNREPSLLVHFVKRTLVEEQRSVIVTGYMFTGLSDLNLPGDVLWLR